LNIMFRNGSGDFGFNGSGARQLECVMPLSTLTRNFLPLIGLLVALVIGIAPCDARAEQRIALVLGNGNYEARALQTTANEAGLVAQTLEAAGFDVIGARDLDHEALGRAFRDFLDKAAGLGQDDVAFVYLGGYGLQLEGENYFLPVDARIERASDIPVQALRLSDYTRALAGLRLKASIVVLDLARAHPFADNERLAGGLALVDAEQGMLIAFNAAPGTIAPAAEGAYGPYAKALAEMMREGGLPLNDVFERVRLRVSDATQGAQVPWHGSNVTGSFVFFERTADAPPSVAANEVSPVLRSRPIRELDAQQAYIAALDRDTLPDYLEFLDSYATDALASRVRAVVAARREALIWRRTRWLDTPAAYWSYLRLYSDGPHVGDCYRRLAFLHASVEVPVEFNAVDYDVPPPLPDENIYFQQPAIFLGDASYGFPPPPPIPEAFLPPPPPDFVALPPPDVPLEVYALPTPIYTPVPVWVRPPRFVQPPPANNVIFANLHNKVAVNRSTRSFTVTDHGGNTRTFQAPRAFQNPEQRDGGRHAGAPRQLPASDASVGPTLPPSVAQLRAMTTGKGVDRASRNQSSPLPLAGVGEPRPPGVLGGPAANRQLPTQQNPRDNLVGEERPQQPGKGVVTGHTQRMQPSQRYGEPLPKPAPNVPGTGTGTTRAQGLWGGSPQTPTPGTPRAAQLPPAQSSAQAGQAQAKPAVPTATTARPQGPAQPAQALPKGPPPSLAQPAPTRQNAEQAAAARAQQQAAQQRAQQQGARQPAQQQAAQQGVQQQAAQQRTQQQAAQQQAAQQRAQQQAAQQQAAQQRAQQQAAQQQAQQAAAARAQAAARASPAIAGARAQHGPPHGR
jgi:uncharacterized caspase-like protein